MAWKSLSALTMWPNFDLPIHNSILSHVTIDFALSNRYSSMIFEVPKSGTITKIGFYNGPSGGGTMTVEASLQTVSGGIPSGSNYGSSAPGTITNPSADTAYEITLATPATATKGDRVAAKIRISALTSGTLRVQYVSQAPNNQLPYKVNSFDAKISVRPGMWVVYNDGSVGEIHGTLPFTAFTTLAFSSSSTPDEVGNYFTSPVKLRAIGVAAMFPSLNGPTSADTMRLYSAANDVLASMSFDVGTVNISGAAGYTRALFSSPVTIEADTVYRLAFAPGATSRDVKYFAYPSQALKVNGWDTNWVYTSRTDSGAWTQTNERALPFVLLVDAIDVPAPGGLLLHPGMAGGMRA